MDKGQFEADMLASEVSRFDGDLSDQEIEQQLDAIYGRFMTLADEMGFGGNYELKEK